MVGILKMKHCTVVISFPVSTSDFKKEAATKIRNFKRDEIIQYYSILKTSFKRNRYRCRIIQCSESETFETDPDPWIRTLDYGYVSCSFPPSLQRCQQKISFLNNFFLLIT
jgi:hypothetical protein